jgi:hypothetical protein
MKLTLEDLQHGIHGPNVLGLEDKRHFDKIFIDEMFKYLSKYKDLINKLELVRSNFSVEELSDFSFSTEGEVLETFLLGIKKINDSFKEIDDLQNKTIISLNRYNSQETINLGNKIKNYRQILTNINKGIEFIDDTNEIITNYLKTEENNKFVKIALIDVKQIRKSYIVNNKTINNKLTIRIIISDNKGDFIKLYEGEVK